MTKEYCLQNIEIARKYLSEYHLIADDNKTVIDCLFLPPFHWKAFYGQVFKEDDHYHINCAYTFYADHWSLTSYSQSFCEADINNNHPSKKSDIICKTFIPNQAVICELTDIIKSCNTISTKEPEICIDGVHAYIRMYDNGKVVRDLLLHNDSDNIIDIIQRLSEEI